MPYLQFAVSIDSLESFHAVLAVPYPTPFASFDRPVYSVEMGEGV